MATEYLHTMVRVLDLDKSIEFYKLLGLVERRRRDDENGRYTLVFMAPPDQQDGRADVELTYNWEQDEPYDRGNAWGHIALKVSDIYATAEYLKEHDVEFIKEPSPMKNGTRVIAFIRDPNGYPIELNEPAGTR